MHCGIDYVNGGVYDMDNNLNYPIVYICDGKNACGKMWGCAYHSSEVGVCKRTFLAEHARYGACEGDPSWYPERFYYDDRCGKWIEKERK